MNNNQGPGISRKITAIVTAKKTVVNNDNRISVVTQWTPADIIVSHMPVDPCRPPNSGWNPVPTQSQSPVPSSITINTPSPRIIRYPGPTDNRIPDPSSVVIWPPNIMGNIRNPHISIRSFMNPTPITG